MAFTLAGISGIQISVFASRSKSGDFYKCGHKNLTNLITAISIALQIAIHLAIIWELARLFGKKRDYLHRGGCVNARANNLGIFYPIIPSERIKTRAMLDIRHAHAVRWPESSRSAISEIFPLVWTSAKISQYFNRDGNLDLSCVWMRLLWACLNFSTLPLRLFNDSIYCNMMWSL